jgi:hypothetical protein
VSARSRWTDERIDDLAVHIEGSMTALRDEVRAVRSDMRAEFRDVRRDMRENHRWQLGLHVSTLLAVVALAVDVDDRRRLTASL